MQVNLPYIDPMGLLFLATMRTSNRGMSFSVAPVKRFSEMKTKKPRCIWKESVDFAVEMLLMEEILHHLGCIKPRK